MSSGDRRTMLTTGQLAAICGVTVRTIVNHCDAGMIKCHLVAGSNHRRITKRSAVKYLLENDMSDLIPLEWGNACDLHMYHKDNPQFCMNCGRDRDLLADVVFIGKDQLPDPSSFLHG